MWYEHTIIIRYKKFEDLNIISSIQFEKEYLFISIRVRHVADVAYYANDRYKTPKINDAPVSSRIIYSVSTLSILYSRT